MGDAKRSYHHGALQPALVAEAIRLIDSRGVDAFSLREAAANLGVSPNAAYRHFTDKAAILTAVASEGFQRLSAAMQAATEAAAGPRPRAGAAAVRFKAVGRAYVRFALAHPELFRLMFGANGAACVVSGGEGPSPRDRLVTALDALVAEGVLSSRQRRGAELKAWAAVHGFAALALDGIAAEATVTEQSSDTLEALLDFVLAGLQT